MVNSIKGCAKVNVNRVNLKSAFQLFRNKPMVRTKWKRQTAVGLELLAEAGNYAAFQRLYGAPPYGCWYPPQSGPSAAPSAADIYYRQAAAAAAVTLQKPLPYRLYPPGMGLGIPGPSAHLGSLAASSSLSSLSTYYSNQSSEAPPPRSPSPDTPLDPGSPGTGGRRSPSEDEDTIHV
ncbi:putative homeobox protein b [Trypoxylus dichotomus]